MPEQAASSFKRAIGLICLFSLSAQPAMPALAASNLNSHSPQPASALAEQGTTADSEIKFTVYAPAPASSSSATESAIQACEPCLPQAKPSAISEAQNKLALALPEPVPSPAKGISPVPGQNTAASQYSADDPAKEGQLKQAISYNVRGAGDLDGLNEEILKKEVDFLRLNTNYRMIATPASKWKPWRMFFFQEATGALATAGATNICATRWRHWQRPALAKKKVFSNGPLLLLLAHSVGLGGLLVEAAFDTAADWKARKKGFDAGTCDKKASDLKAGIEKLLAERESLVNSDGNLSQQQRELLASEGTVMKDVKDCAALEFSKLRGRAGKLRAARHATNLFQFTQLTTGGYVGALCNMLAANNRKPKLALPAGVGFIVSGSAITLTPWASKLATIVAAKDVARKEKQLLGPLNADAPKNFDLDRKVLSDRLMGAASDDQIVRGILNHASIFDLQDEVLDKQAAMAKREAEKTKKDFKERCLASAIIGGVKMNWGIQLVNAGLNWSASKTTPVPKATIKMGALTFKPNAVRTPTTKAQQFNHRVAVAATSYIPGNAAIILDGLQSRVRGEKFTSDQKKAGTAPGQILKQRMATLDKMDKLLSSK